MPDEIQFREIYEAYKQLVFNLALHYVQHTEDARDITQEAFVKIYRHLDSHHPEQASLKTWIYRITVNQCLDFLRKKKAQKRFGFLSSLFRGEQEEPLEIAAPGHPGMAAEDKETLERLFRLINRLPEKQRTVLILMKIEEKSQKETAEILQTTVKAVESLLQRARQNLEKNWGAGEG